MPLGWCCTTWLDLSKELAELKEASLNKLISKGIPRSTFSPVLRIIENIDCFCPMCGTSLKQLPITTPPIQSLPPTQEKPAPSITPATIKCPPCRGTGKVGAGLNCMTCLGSGVLDKSNPMRRRFDPKFAEELESKIENANRKIAKVTEHISQHPLPLREEAKPENWGK